jgi:hypothetical protein
MKAIFTYLTGGRAGRAVVVEKGYARRGRAPQADVRFGPDHDLPVSGRHAAVVFRDGDWILRDLASTNGTFVNGERIKGEHPLGDQDLIRLGDGGPMLRFGVVRDAWRPSADQMPVPAPPVPEPEPTGAAATVPKTPRSTASAAGDDGRFVVTVTATRQRAPWVAALLVVTVLGSLGGLAMWRARASKGAIDARAVLLTQADSLFATLEAIGRRNARISGALDGAKAETARLRSRIRRAPRDQQVLAPLRDSLDRLSSNFERLAAAAALDAEQIARTSEGSLALVEATYEDGTRRVAAAFRARGAGGTIVFVTIQDVMRDAAGHRATMITVRPSGGDKPLRSRALAAHGALNIAILEVPRGSSVAAPATLASRVGGGLIGQAAVLVGYPSARQGHGTSAPAHATALAAVTIANEKLLQLEPLGPALAPGSPVFDRSGTVIGMLLPAGTSEHLLDAVPAPAITAFLDGNAGDR